MNAYLPLRRSLRWSAALFLVAGLAGAGWIFKTPAARGTPAKSAADDEPAVICLGHVDVEGGVASLAPTQPGRVVAIEVREGQSVRAGQALVKLDDGQARLRLQEAEAALDAAERQLEQARQLPGQHQAQLTQQTAAVEAARHRLASAQHQLQRQRDLAKHHLVSPADVDSANESVRSLEAAVRAEEAKFQELRLLDPRPAVQRAEAEVASLRDRRAQAQLALDDCTLKAPRDGKVLRLQTNVGDLIGVPGSLPAVLFCADGPRIIRAEAAQEFAAAVKLGAPCRILDDAASGGTTWHGRIARISDWYTHRRSVLLEPAQFNDVRTLECQVKLDPGQPPLRIGQRVRVLVGRP